MSDTARARKLADRVREVVAEALEKRIKDRGSASSRSPTPG